VAVEGLGPAASTMFHVFMNLRSHATRHMFLLALQAALFLTTALALLILRFASRLVHVSIGPQT
jgi:hypothetical protein